MKTTLVIAACLITLSAWAQSENDPTEVAAVVAAVKAANPDMKAVCQKGPDGIRQATTSAVMGLMGGGKIKGNPGAVGGEAGQKIGAECRGG
jgi:hypothetical protein